MSKMKDNAQMHNKSYANVQTFKDYGTALTNQDCMHENIKRKIKFRKFLLPFSPDYYVFPFANQKCKLCNLQNCNFVCLYVCVCVCVCGTRWVTLRKEHQTEGIQEQDAEEDIWPKRGQVTEGWRNLYSEELHDLFCSTNIHNIWVIIPEACDGWSV
jgi:hypothetical protein